MNYLQIDIYKLIFTKRLAAIIYNYYLHKSIYNQRSSGMGRMAVSAAATPVADAVAASFLNSEIL